MNIQFRYEKERHTRMIISRNATIRIKKSKEKVHHTHQSLSKFTSQKLKFYISDCENVWSGCCHLCDLLGTLPYLFHHHLSQPINCQDPVHWPHLPSLLLACNVPDVCQPHHLLLDEQVHICILLLPC